MILYVSHHPGLLEISYDRHDELPHWIYQAANEYEGDIPYRVGFNFPLTTTIRTQITASLPSSNVSLPSITYVIVYPIHDADTYRHELLHFLYYRSEEYRRWVEREWSRQQPLVTHKAEKQLQHMGYPPVRWLDEWQAYTFSSSRSWKPIWTKYTHTWKN